MILEHVIGKPAKARALAASDGCYQAARASALSGVPQKHGVLVGSAWNCGSVGVADEGEAVVIRRSDGVADGVVVAP